MVSDSEIQFNQSDSDNNYSDTDSEKEMNVDEKKPQVSFFEEISQSDILESASSEIQILQSKSYDVSEPEARRLLQNNQWDVDKALKALSTESKRSRRGKKRKRKTASVKRKCYKPRSSILECEVCMDEVSQDDRANVACRHVFCKECLKDSILENINNRIVDIKCPGEGCEQLLSFDDILNALADEELKNKFLRLFGQSYVDNNKNTAWCPGTDCEIAFSCKEFHNDHKVVCKEGHKSCFNCQGTWHDPLDCGMLKKWLKKCEDDSETSNWISANTKECPKCYSQIEKNGGCNHMTCSKCKHQMCWLCMADWGGSHKCVQKEEDNRISDSRKALKRYLRYHEFYAGHKKSLEIESKITMESVYERYQKPQQPSEEGETKDKKEKEDVQSVETNDAPADFFQRTLIQKACEVLKECRNTLMCSYVFAFYLEDGTQTKMVFEHNQGHLQGNVERLSAFLEREVHMLNDNKTTQAIGAAVDFCQNTSKQLIDHVKEQKTANAWVYHEFNQ